MTLSLQEQIDEWAANGLCVATQIRKRLRASDRERAKWQVILDGLPPSRESNIDRTTYMGTEGIYSPISQTVLDIVMEEAGSEGLYSSDIYDACVQELGSTSRDAVMTAVSRFKRKGIFLALGPRRQWRYIYNERCPPRVKVARLRDRTALPPPTK